MLERRIIKLNEARSRLGFEPVPDAEDGFLMSMGTELVNTSTPPALPTADDGSTAQQEL